MLTRETILSAGLELLDEVGPQRLTMRALAQRLGVTATAIYHYFDGKDDLVEGVVDMVCARVVADVPAEGEWPDRLRALLTGMVDQTLEHPSVVAWSIMEYARRPPVLQIHEAMLGILDDGGFAPEAALYVKGALLRYCVGHLILRESAPGVSWRDLPGDRFAHYRAAGGALDAFDPVRQFRLGLDALLAGLAEGPAAGRRSRLPLRRRVTRGG